MPSVIDVVGFDYKVTEDVKDPDLQEYRTSPQCYNFGKERLVDMQCPGITYLRICTHYPKS